jgi:hypothetical protein
LLGTFPSLLFWFCRYFFWFVVEIHWGIN